MIDNLLPLPDDDLCHDKDIKYSYGPYREVRYCGKCRYFLLPMTLHFENNLCPNCGSYSFNITIGRYKIKSIRKGFVFKSWDTKIIGFLVKQSGEKEREHAKEEHWFTSYFCVAVRPDACRLWW